MSSYKTKYSRIRRKKHKELGLCSECQKKAEFNRSMCSYHLKRFSERMKKYMRTPHYKELWKIKNKRWKINNIKQWCNIMDKNQKRFRDKHPRYMNKKSMEYYYRNKEKYQSRRDTLSCLKKLNIQKVCKLCNSKDRVQIHHEVYPTIETKIIKAIAKGKIYYLCHICHKKSHGSLRY